jgi:dGTPase
VAGHPVSAYDDSARQRRVDEPPKRAGAAHGSASRTEFQRDRARVLHSYAFRRLADKTQVVVPGEDDFPRTRLTHSLEVAQIGREIASALGCDPDVVDAAGLAHDIGHPPFGHNGEDALNAVAAECGGFEGNAQTLRVLTRLEAKVLWPDGEPAGLNLTRAVLDACCKYPWARRDGVRKYGYYDQDAGDAAAFAWMRAGATGTGVDETGLDETDVPGERRCLEAQVMDWADDVAYSVHDIEDGVHAGLLRLESVDTHAREQVTQLAAELYSDLTAADLVPVLDELLDLPTLRDLAGYDGSHAAQAAAKRATSELVGRLSGAAVLATRDVHGAVSLGRYAASLVVPADVAAECALLKAVAAHYVMGRPGAAERQAWQRHVLTELVAAVRDGAPGTLDRSLIAAWHSAATDADRLRVVIDQVAQLTDTSAVAWHARLVRPR